MSDPKPEKEQFRDFGVHPQNRPSARIPDAASERRLAQLRSNAWNSESAQATHDPTRGIKARDLAPGQFPHATPETGYYGIHMLKEPQWTHEIPLYFFIGGAGGAAAVLAEAARMTRWDEGSKLVSDADPDPALVGVLVEMGDRAEEMLRVALESFSNRDLAGAESLVELDELIDRANRRFVERLVDVMAEPDLREWGLRMVVVARTIERIGDRAVDIGEQTAYLLTAEFREFTDASHPV